MKFLFLYPTTDSFSLDDGEKSFMYAPTLGILYLSSVLRDNGHEAKVIDIRGEENPGEAIKNEIRNTDAIGITVPTFALNNSRKIVGMIRDIDSSIPIVMGGPHPTLYPHASLKEINADIAVVGEAENSILDVTKILEGKQGAEEGRGVYYRENDGIHVGKKAEIIDDLNSIPFPAHDLVKKYDYGSSYGFKLFKGKTTAVLASRGCPRRCSFCSRRLLYMGIYRKRNAENVVGEIEMLYERGYENVIIADDNFTSDMRKVDTIMDMIMERGIELTLLVNGARVDSADERVYSKMWDAGVRLISFGLESGNQEILDFYRKDITLDQIRRAVDISNKTGFFTIGNFIIGAPIETEKEIKNTIKFASSLPLDMAEFFILRYMPGSELWERALKGGKIGEDEYLVESDCRKGLGNFTREELIHWKNLAYKNFYFRPLYIANELRKFISRFDIRLIKAGFSMLKILRYRTKKDEKVWKMLEK
ncbi:MAG: radical SAM protein [Candidatus Thermoplasmatota archaeon]|nr:radical SAM protein [Candidatus Thermoplasmatota archaeon]